MTTLPAAAHLLPVDLRNCARSWRGLLAPVLLGVALAGCSGLGGQHVSSAAPGSGNSDEIRANRSIAAEGARQRPVRSELHAGASLADLAPARLAPLRSQACIAAIETMAEKYSGRRVMLGERAFVDSSELVLDQVFARDSDGRIIEGRRLGQPNPFVIQLRFGPRGCMAVVPAQTSAIRPVPASVLLPDCRCLSVPEDASQAR